jgi:glyoxylase-like metal-dependent hydrolase (beta-lactamase superfamily II)
MRPLVALLAVTTLLPAGHGRQPDVPTGFIADTLAPGVVAFVRREPVAYGMQSNSLLIVGERYAAVVDAQNNLTDTRAVIAAIRAITPRPVRYVINTHCHDDHVTGNVEYRKAFPGVNFVASRAMAEEMDGICATNRAAFRKSGLGTVKFLRDLVAKNQSLLGGTLPEDERIAHLSYARYIESFVAESEETAVHPTMTFDDRLSLDLGGRAIEALHLGRGHSRGDVIVHLPDAGVIAAGDLVVWPVPLVGTTSYPGDYAATLHRLLALKPHIVLPGHGPLLRDTTYIHDVTRLLESIRSQVAAGIARGDSLPALRNAVDLSEFRALFGGGSKLRLGLFDNYVKSSAIPAEFTAQKPRAGAGPVGSSRRPRQRQ